MNQKTKHRSSRDKSHSAPRKVHQRGDKPHERRARRPANSRTARRKPPRPDRIFHLERRVLMDVCTKVNTPRSMAVFLLAQAGEWDQYLALPAPDRESSTFPDDYLVSEMLKKHSRLPNITADPEGAAIRKWYESEEQCSKTNRWINAYLEGTCDIPSYYAGKIQQMRNVIGDVLGKLTAGKLQFIENNFRDGPGSSSSVKGRFVLPSRKMITSVDVTPKLYPYWRTLLSEISQLESASADGSHVRLSGRPLQTEVRVLASSKVLFADKTALIKRPITGENSGNIRVQLGIGAYFRHAIKRVGLYLDKQADINRRRVLVAHLNKDATIDLASASDTVASSLVTLLFPPCWSYLLDVARCEYADVHGELVRLEKFSGMGNGYTFELETLIFYAACAACGQWGADVFGDDIIVSQDSAPKVIDLLQFLGFSVNESKTYLAGTFFESCGVDVSRGVNVRPFYLKGKYESFDTACIRICNKIRLYAHRRNHHYGCDRRFLSAWLCAHRASARASATGIPVGFGNDGIIRNFDEWTPTIRRSNRYAGWGGYLCRVLPVKSPISAYSHPVGVYALALQKSALEKPGDGLIKQVASAIGGFLTKTSRSEEPVRGRSITAQCHSTQVVPEWVDLGPWI